MLSFFPLFPVRPAQKTVFATKSINLIIGIVFINKLNYCSPCKSNLRSFAMLSDSKSASDWQDLLRIAQGGTLVVERIRIPEKQITVEGSFTLPELARISLEDQIFITAFVRSHGSIKEMEQVFGVSYPTIKARLTRIANSLPFVESNPTPSRTEILDRLQRGEITAEDAIRELEL